MFNTFAHKHKGKDIYPPVLIKISILFFLIKKNDLKNEIIKKIIILGILNKFFEILGISINLKL